MRLLRYSLIVRSYVDTASKTNGDRLIVIDEIFIEFSTAS